MRAQIFSLIGRQGQVFVLPVPPEIVEAERLKEGDWVKVTLEREGDELTATVKKEETPAAGAEGG